MNSTAVIALPYCDNLIIGAGEESLANESREAVTRRLEEVGFRVHEVEAAQKWTESLGFLVDGLSGHVGPTQARAERIRVVCRWLMGRPLVTGRAPEKFCGHVTFQLMGNRALLSMMRAI